MLFPAIVEAARTLGANAIALIDVGRSAGLNLNVDRVGITYGDDGMRGDPASPVQVGCSVVGSGRVPSRGLPEVVARVVVDIDPVNLADPNSAQRLLAHVGPDRPDERARLEAEIALARADPPLRLRGDPTALLPDALALVPEAALPILTTTWALSRFPPERRQRFYRGLQAASAERPLAWVSAEGVGLAPSVPTLGDRPASGHSIIGLAVFDGSSARPAALGRCWSRGRMLEWLANTD